MKKLFFPLLIFLVAATFSACCFPHPIGQGEAERIGLDAVDIYCKVRQRKSTEDLIKSSDFKLLKAESEATFINYNQRIMWTVSYIALKPDGSPDVVVYAFIDRCGEYQMSAWNYSKNRREEFL